MNKNHFLGSTLVIVGATFFGPVVVGCSGVNTVDSESEGVEEGEGDAEGSDAEEVAEAEAALTTWNSQYAYLGSSGKLVYKTDGEGNRIPDFGYVGYNYGGNLPNLTVKKTISAKSGDNTSHIQSAVDEVGKLAKDGNGFRGAVLLKAGTYSTSNPVYVPYDGVVIRGEGSSTLIKSTRTGKDVAVFVLGAKDSDQEWSDEVSNTKVAITNTSVPIGQRKFNVADATKFKVGDLVVVQHVPKSAWFTAVGNGSTHGDPGWSEIGEDFTARHVRSIKAISGKEITVDAPFYMNLKSNLATLSMFKYNPSGSGAKVYSKLGIENMKIDIDTNGGTDEDHTLSAVRFQGVMDGWARALTTRYFSESGVEVWRSSRITVQDCLAGPPVSQITGGRRYNFSVNRGGQQVLFKNDTATDGRHGFVSNGRMGASGIVVHGGKLVNNITGSEGHLHWTTGMLFDSSQVVSHNTVSNNDNTGFCAYNRGNWGTSHGWGSANSVLWNIKGTAVTKNLVQKPPSAQNYAIGVDGATGDGPFDEPAGAIEGTGKGSTMALSSLYLAQLKERQASGAP